MSSPPQFTLPLGDDPKILDSADQGDLKALERILASDASQIHAKSLYTGETALHCAAHANHPRVVKRLLEAGADVNARNNHGQTPLHRAANNGNLQVAKILLSAGCDINAVDKAGFTVLDLALCQLTDESIAVAELLLQHKCVIDLKSAVELGDVKRVRALVEADPGAVASFPLAKEFISQAIGFACDCGTSTWHLPHGYQPSVDDYLQIIDLLVKCGIDINVVSSCGDAAIHLAPRYPVLEAVFLERLIQLGADVNLPRSFGLPSLDVFAKLGNWNAEAIARMKENESELPPDLRFGRTESPLQIALANNNTVAAEVLRAHGATE